MVDFTNKADLEDFAQRLRDGTTDQQKGLITAVAMTKKNPDLMATPWFLAPVLFFFSAERKAHYWIISNARLNNQPFEAVLYWMVNGTDTYDLRSAGG